MGIETLLSRLDKVRPNGHGKWLASCPAHLDKSPSLGVKITDEGKILLHCFAGCSVVDIVSAVGLELSDLMPENPAYKKGNKPPKFNKVELFDRLAFESLVLGLAIRQILANKQLSESDLARVLLAEQTIFDIEREARQ